MSRALLSLPLSVAALLVAADSLAEDVSPVGLSLSIERVAGVAYASLRPTGSSRTEGITTFGIAGPAVNPISLPRVGADVLLPMGLTLGGGVGYGHATVSDNPDNGQSSSTSASAWLLSPRVGWMVRPAPLLDLWPRAGLTFASASLQNPDVQQCSFSGGMQTCTTVSGDSQSITFIALSVEVAAALRLTRSFNLLGGLAYDHVISASGSATSFSASGASTSQDTNVQGKYAGPELWFGLGGYVL
jgi:hypothetical protein